MDKEAFREKRSGCVSRLATFIMVVATVCLLVALVLANREETKTEGLSYIFVYGLAFFVIVGLSVTQWINSHKGESLWGWAFIWLVVSFGGLVVGGALGAIFCAVGFPVLLWIFKTAIATVFNKISGE